MSPEYSQLGCLCTSALLSLRLLLGGAFIGGARIVKDFLKLLAVAAVLFAAFVAYDQWTDKNECVVLKRKFMSGVMAMSDDINSGGVLSYDKGRDSSSLMSQLNAQCPDWQDGTY